MRHLTLALLTAGGLALVTSAPVQAQAYDPDYPVCLQTYGPIDSNNIECAYTSLAQCNMSASGRPAECYTNPYYANGYQGAPRPGRHHRHRRHP